jgi:tight adherence protein B
VTAGGADGPGLLAGLCGATVVAGVLLILTGLRAVPAEQARRADWAVTMSRARAVVRRRGLVLAAAGAGVLVLAVTGWPTAALAAAVAVGGGPRLLSGSGTRAQLARLEALEAWIRRLADLLGSGLGGLEQAIAMSVRTSPAPIAAEVTTLEARIRLLGPEPALRAFADDLADLGSPAADLAAAALILRARRGGRGLRPVLDALAAEVGELVRARRAIEADRAKPRTNVRALLAITAVVLGLSVVFARDYLAPFGTATGQLMLTAILALLGAAAVLLARITRPPATPRFLSAATDHRRPHRTRLAGRTPAAQRSGGQFSEGSSWWT